MTHEPECWQRDEDEYESVPAEGCESCVPIRTAYNRGREDAAKQIENDWSGWNHLILKNNAVLSARGKQ